MMTKRKPWTWKNVRLPKLQAEELGRSFQMELYRSILDHEPENLELLLELGNLYTLTGQVKEGLQIDKRLVELQPAEPIFHYNLACSHSLLNEVDAALGSLLRAVELGYNNLEYLQEDSDLANIREDERYYRILDRLRREVERSQGS